MKETKGRVSLYDRWFFKLIIIMMPDMQTSCCLTWSAEVSIRNPAWRKRNSPFGLPARCKFATLKPDCNFRRSVDRSRVANMWKDVEKINYKPIYFFWKNPLSCSMPTGTKQALSISGRVGERFRLWESETARSAEVHQQRRPVRWAGRKWIGCKRALTAPRRQSWKPTWHPV